ncbi:MAG: class I SAM-dependent methyltransferase [Deltaproteobacteria bacterium]|nr:class I SAM-dependent methyltransferase [Deltaproteobacteria bacterium]
MSIDVAVNERTWNSPEVVATYTARRYITPAEVRVLGTCWSKIAGGKVLDIGIGTGRTVPFLAPFAASYSGIDYMPNMVAAARRQHPNRDLRQADARELPFADGEFSFVLFSFNGIDYVDPDHRPRILGEAHRVLARGGLFVYSTHNLAARGGDARSRFAASLPQLHVSRPARAAAAVVRGLAANVRAYRNFRKLEHQQRVGSDVAFILDGAHEYSLFTCYVTQAYERRALATAGFTVRDVIEPDGRLAGDSSSARDLYFVNERA